VQPTLALTGQVFAVRETADFMEKAKSSQSKISGRQAVVASPEPA